MKGKSLWLLHPRGPWNWSHWLCSVASTLHGQFFPGHWVPTAGFLQLRWIAACPLRALSLPVSDHPEWKPHHHLRHPPGPQPPHTHVLLSLCPFNLWSLLHNRYPAQDAYQPALCPQDTLLHGLCHPDVLLPRLCCHQLSASGSYGLWPLHRHLPAFALPRSHELEGVRTAGSNVYF